MEEGERDGRPTGSGSRLRALKEWLAHKPRCAVMGSVERVNWRDGDEEVCNCGLKIQIQLEAAVRADTEGPASQVNHYGKSLTVAVESGALVISIGVDVLAHAVRHAEWANPYDEDKHEYIRTFAITNPEAFAKDVTLAMRREKENGASMLSDFLDAATKDAVDDGSEACEYDMSIPAGADTEGRQEP